MTVSTIASVASGAIQRAVGNNGKTYTSSIKSLLAATGATSNRNDVALTTAISMQTQVSGLRAASLSLAQNSSMVEVASAGVGQINRALGRLQELAERASGGDLSEGARDGLKIEFQSLLSQITRIANTSQFGNKPLLDGSVTGEALGLEGTDGIPNLTSDAIFSEGELSISSSESAQRALEKIADAQNFVTQVAVNIGNMGEALEYGSSTVQSALQNQEAARSVLSEGDFTQAATQSAQVQVQNEASLSLLAQTNRLPGNILQLIAE